MQEIPQPRAESQSQPVTTARNIKLSALRGGAFGAKLAIGWPMLILLLLLARTLPEQDKETRRRLDLGFISLIVVLIGLLAALIIAYVLDGVMGVIWVALAYFAIAISAGCIYGFLSALWPANYRPL